MNIIKLHNIFFIFAIYLLKVSFIFLSYYSFQNKWYLFHFTSLPLAYLYNVNNTRPKSANIPFFPVKNDTKTYLSFYWATNHLNQVTFMPMISKLVWHYERITWKPARK